MIDSIAEFYSQIYNLCFIKRYSVIPRLHEESIAEHSFFVAAIVVKLYDEYDFDIGRALTMAVIHDWTESYTDDITIATKRAFPGIARAVEEAECLIAETEFSDLTFDIWREYKKSITIEAKIVKYADTLQVIQYAQSEINLGNMGYMVSVLEDALKRSEMPEKELEGYKWERN